MYHSACTSFNSELRIDIEEFFEPTTQCCIYRVPKNLRKINEEAYTPRLVSIGPFHMDNKELADMEKEKRRYKKSFIERLADGKWKELKAFVENHEQEIRRYYDEPFEFSSDKFAEMILHDAVFIIELFLRYYHRDKVDFLLNKLRLKAIRRDLILLENQLPYFVLEKLYCLAFSSTTRYVTSATPDGASANKTDGTITSNPNDASTRNPDGSYATPRASTSNPSGTTTSNPNEAFASNPNEASASNPDEPTTSIPNEASTSNPDEPNTSNPNEASDSNLDEAPASNLDESITNNPNKASTTNPDEAYATPKAFTTNLDGPTASDPNEAFASNPNKPTTNNPNKVSLSNPDEPSTNYPDGATISNPDEATTSNPDEAGTSYQDESIRPADEVSLSNQDEAISIADGIPLCNPCEELLSQMPNHFGLCSLIHGSYNRPPNDEEIEVNPEGLLPSFHTLSCKFFVLHCLQNRRKIESKHFTDMYRDAMVKIHQHGRFTYSRRQFANREDFHAEGEISPTTTLDTKQEIQPTTTPEELGVEEENESLLTPKGHTEEDTHPTGNSKVTLMVYLPNAVKLKEAGVKFKPLLTNCLGCTDFIKRRLLVFQMVQLQIPCIEIKDDTECLIRNVMALEQFHYPSETYISSYIRLMSSLINSEEDVDLLIEEGIIKNSAGVNAVIVDMFNKICQQIPEIDSNYSNIYNDLRAHYDNKFNHLVATIESVLGNPFKVIGALVGGIFFLLTFVGYYGGD